MAASTDDSAGSSSTNQGLVRLMSHSNGTCTSCEEAKVSAPMKNTQ